MQVYDEFKEELQTENYQITEEQLQDDFGTNYIAIKIFQNDVEIGHITFTIAEHLIGSKRPTTSKYRNVEEIETNVCSISFIEVETDFQGRGFGYYLMLLACLYTKQNFPDVTKVKLDDCSDKSGDVVGNIYFKLKMTPIEPQELLLPNKVPGSVPLSNKKGSLHVRMCEPERLGNINDIILAARIKIGRRGGKKRNKTKKIRKIRKSKRIKRTRHNKKSRKSRR
jgi:hypothetical protein